MQQSITKSELAEVLGGAITLRELTSELEARDVPFCRGRWEIDRATAEAIIDDLLAEDEVHAAAQEALDELFEVLAEEDDGDDGGEEDTDDDDDDDEFDDDDDDDDDDADDEFDDDDESEDDQEGEGAGVA